MRYVIFILLSISMAVVCMADFTAFDFSLGRYIVDEGKDINVNFQFFLFGYEKESFLIRPVLKNGIVEIFNSKDGVWVSSDTNLSNLPSFEDTVVIRIKGLGVEKSGIYFEVFNTVSGVLYKTPEKAIWSREVYSEYIKSVNKVLMHKKTIREEKDVVDYEYLNSVEIDTSGEDSIDFNKHSNLDRVYIFIAFILSFLITYFIGCRVELRKYRERKNLDIYSRVYSVNGKIH